MFVLILWNRVLDVRVIFWKPFSVMYSFLKWHRFIKKYEFILRGEAWVLYLFCCFWILLVVIRLTCVGKTQTYPEVVILDKNGGHSAVFSKQTVSFMNTRKLVYLLKFIVTVIIVFIIYYLKAIQFIRIVEASGCCLCFW